MSMKPSILFDPDDPALTAYALGELTDAAERAQVERLLAESAETRAALEEIRALTTALSAEYEQERALTQNEAPQTAQAVAPNVIVMPVAERPPRGGSWMGWLLKAAAVLLVLGILAGVRLPVFNSVQVEGRKPAARWAAQQQIQPEEMPAAIAAATPPPAAASPVRAPLGLLAENGASEKASSMLPAAKPMIAATPAFEPDGSLLAQAASPTVPTAERRRDFRADDAPKMAPASPTDLLTAARPVAQDRLRESAPHLPEGTPMAQVNKNLAETNQEMRQLAQNRLPDALLKSNPAASNKPESPAFSFSAKAKPASAPPSPASPAKEERAKLAVTTPRAINQPIFDTKTDKDGVKREEFEGFINYGSPIQAVPPVADSSSAVSSQLKSLAGSAARGRAASNEMMPRRPSEMAALAGISADKQPTPGSGETRIAAPVGAVPMLGDVPITGSLFRSKASDEEHDTAAYDHLVENAFLSAKENPLSTFSIDVDTASYSNVRRFIESGRLPPKDAVRIEELLNYFPYADVPPAPDNEKPFAIHLEAAACPWDTDHRLVRIGIKGREMARDKRPPSNLVFLLDVSGSMTPPERLPLIKESLRLLVEKLTEDDRVAIVVYAGASGLVLPSTGGDRKERILAALEKLRPGGSTNGASGIQLAYKVAQEHFIKDGVNRVILATDGDFNVGVTNQGDLVRLIEEKAKSGVFLSVLGVGTDNYKDSTMQKLADRGNGNYAYIDRIEEGRKVLVEQMSGTLVTIAKDVKIQVEFNPATVAAYRLIGYEKRMLKKEDFNNDKIDAGEIGVGHSVTALFEIVPAGQKTPLAAPAVDALKYQQPPAASAPVREDSDKDERKPASSASAGELLTVKMRHKAPDSDKSERSYEEALAERDTSGDFANASPDFKFAAAVASFGLVLRDSPYKGNASLGAAIELAQEGKGADASGYRAGFIELARRAQALREER
jgi:Ca-activated chloride channel family protein